MNRLMKTEMILAPFVLLAVLAAATTATAGIISTGEPERFYDIFLSADLVTDTGLFKINIVVDATGSGLPVGALEVLITDRGEIRKSFHLNASSATVSSASYKTLGGTTTMKEIFIRFADAEGSSHGVISLPSESIQQVFSRHGPADVILLIDFEPDGVTPSSIFLGMAGVGTTGLAFSKLSADSFVDEF